MRFSPYAKAAQLIKPKSQSPQSWPGLPALTKTPQGRNKEMASTRTPFKPQPFADIAGMPSAKLVKLPQGVAAVINRQSRYADWMTEDDLREVQSILDKMVNEAERLSKGPLTLAQLRRLGHPYGRGRKNTRGRRRRGLGRIQRQAGFRGGVSNMAVVNKQSGELAKSWKGDLTRGKGGARLWLINESKHSKHTAFGTPRMKAHGPYATVPARYESQLNRAWMKAARTAYLRQQAMLKQRYLGDANA